MEKKKLKKDQDIVWRYVSLKGASPITTDANPKRLSPFCGQPGIVNRDLIALGKMKSNELADLV